MSIKDELTAEEIDALLDERMELLEFFKERAPKLLLEFLDWRESKP